MNRNDLLTLAQRLREYNHNPHHINPTSEAFHKLIDEAASALSILATPPADAADMGGQAGEEVQQQITIVQYLDTKGSRKALGAMNAKLRCKVGHLERRIAEQCEEIEILHKQLDRFREKSHGIPALAEHERLSEELAQHRQQAGKLVEALSACRSELHAMITAHNVQSEHDGSWLYDYQTVSEADEALADWEKTQ